MGVVPYVLLGWIALSAAGFGVEAVNVSGRALGVDVSETGADPCPVIVERDIGGTGLDQSIMDGCATGGFSAYLATTSRYTWVFAPAIWSAMLELGSGTLERNHLSAHTWKRAIIMALAGLAGGVLIPNLMNIWTWIQGEEASISLGQGVNVANLSNKVADQPLLWYRLLPNATYGNGILLGLLIVVAPLIIVLVYLYASRIWALNSWQRLAIILPLLAFLAVGLIASTKIGGGGDLHNMDMFLIGVMFSVVLAGGEAELEWMRTMARSPAWMRV